MLATQSAAIHVLVMTSANDLMDSNIYQQDINERKCNKLARTFLGQVEGFKRYRSNGEPTVTVQKSSSKRGPSSDRPTRDTASSRGRVRQGLTAGHHGCADGSNGHRRRTSPGAPSVNSQVGYMTGDHPRNNGPMLASPRGGAKTRLGGSSLAGSARQGTLSDAWRRAGIRRADGKSKRPQTRTVHEGRDR